MWHQIIEAKASFTFFSVSDTTATMVTSEPVPEVVGITKMVLKLSADCVHRNISAGHRHLQTLKYW